MNPDIKQLQEQLDKLQAEFNLLKANATIPFDIYHAFKARIADEIYSELFAVLPEGLTDAPLGSITAPTGGATIDSEARTAINTVITRLESLGLVNPN